MKLTHFVLLRVNRGFPDWQASLDLKDWVGFRSVFTFITWRTFMDCIIFQIPVLLQTISIFLQIAACSLNFILQGLPGLPGLEGEKVSFWVICAVHGYSCPWCLSVSNCSLFLFRAKKVLVLLFEDQQDKRYTGIPPSLMVYRYSFLSRSMQAFL